MAKFIDPLTETFFDPAMWKRDFKGSIGRMWKGDKLLIVWRKGGGYWWRHRRDGETKSSSIGFDSEREAQINLARTLGIPVRGM